MLPTDSLLSSATQAWEVKRLEDETNAAKTLESRAMETADLLLAIAPVKAYAFDGEKVLVEGLEFVSDYDTVTGYHAKKVLWLLQYCPKCGTAERYRIEFLWNIGQVVQENYIGTRHTCIIQAVTEKGIKG